MITLEREASTIGEFQEPDVIQIQPSGYFCIQFKDYPLIATQSSGSFSAETPRKYLYQCSIDADTSYIFVTSSHGQQESPLLIDDLVWEETSGVFHSIRDRIQAHLYHEIFETPSSHVAHLSLGHPELEQTAIDILYAYQHEQFDADIAYEFTNELDAFIQSNGEYAISIISNLIKKQSFGDHIISETLKALGRIEHEKTKDQRYQILMGFIQNKSAIIRDAAVSGLSFLDDKRALLQLRMLLEKESVTLLKNNIRVAIKSLEA